MAATWSGSSDDSNEGDESLDDEDIMANFLAFASSYNSKSASEKRKGVKRKMTQVKKKVIPYLTP